MTTVDEARHIVTALVADRSLLGPRELRRRLDAIDWLDALAPLLGGLPQAARLRRSLEAHNTAIYQSLRDEIRRGSRDALRIWIEQCNPEPGAPAPGLSYDVIDALLAGVLQLRDPGPVTGQPDPETVFYQPTPARHILRLIELCSLSRDDVLVDLGSGLGHVPLVVSILTEARAIGIEHQPGYAASARQCAHSLRCDRIAFFEQDARDADLSAGAVFYLYTPFTGEILHTMLRRLKSESRQRVIRIATLGPCTHTVAEQPWLRAETKPNPEQITLFQSSSKD